MNAILVDDEKMALEELAYFLKEEDVTILNMFMNPLEALEKFLEYKPDIVFLDIDMPELDGFSLASEILKIREDVYIVFVTAFHDYAVKAFEIDALDYIEKPFDSNRIKKLINKLEKRNRINTKEELNRKEESNKKEETNKKEQTNKKEEPNKKEEMNKKESLENYLLIINKNIKKIPVWKNDRIFLLDINEIVFFTANAGDVMAFCNSQEIYYTKETLNYWENRLKEKGFFRCHKSFLVNIDKIIEIIPWFNNTYNLRVSKSQETIPVSRNYIKSFKSIFEL